MDAQRGTLQSDDPDEEKKQKDIKGLLNKITPEKYETIRDKVIATGIDNAKTLRGLIDQAGCLPSTLCFCPRWQYCRTGRNCWCRLNACWQCFCPYC